MAVVVRFTTDLFDVARERENPINPIYGESLLRWLGERIGGAHALTPPEAEDWGWYSMLDWQGRQYLIGSSASDEEGGQREWILQIEKMRSFSEKLLGREWMAQDDACAAYVQALLAAEPAFRGISRD